MAQSTLASATSLLKTALLQKFGLSVIVQAGSVEALRKGQIIWDNPTSPGNHSMFQYYAPTPGDVADSAQDLGWGHLTSTEGRGVKSGGGRHPEGDEAATGNPEPLVQSSGVHDRFSISGAFTVSFAATTLPSTSRSKAWRNG
jgi:hypothetical protein